ncbi:hypothetical protein FOZ62_024397, partial [Perkinsus olseni]
DEVALKLKKVYIAVSASEVVLTPAVELLKWQLPRMRVTEDTLTDSSGKIRDVNDEYANNYSGALKTASVRAPADCGTSAGLIDGGEADWKLTEEMAEQDYCCEQALARRWLQNERSCRLAFVRLGLLTPPACSTLSRAFSAVAERVM